RSGTPPRRDAARAPAAARAMTASAAMALRGRVKNLRIFAGYLMPYRGGHIPGHHRAIVETLSALDPDNRAVAVLLNRVARNHNRGGGSSQRHVERCRQVRHQVGMGAIHINEHDEVT